MDMRFWPKRKWKQALLVAFIVIVIVVPVGFGVLGYVNREPAFKSGAASTLAVSSPAFENGAPIARATQQVHGNGRKHQPTPRHHKDS